MYTKNQKSRRDFLKAAAAFAGVMSSFAACDRKAGPVSGSMVSSGSKLGHMLRDGEAFPEPGEELVANVLIVGSGIAGLSARRWLGMHGIADVLTLELEDHTGGNSSFGENAVSAFPWGAHYLPIPDHRNKELIDFLKQSGTVTSITEEGLPVYDEYQLCHDPEERLFINGYWQEGLVPDFGVAVWEKEQMHRFFREMEIFRRAVGNDGRDAFAIPLDRSSADPAFRQLDNFSFADWLKRKGFTAPHLLWYLEYGCKDDYGCTLSRTSAWAGIHYFASRKGRAANASSSSLLTWPEGNGFLMKQLQSQASSEIKTGWMVCDMKRDEHQVVVTALDKDGKTVRIKTNKVLMATPQYVNKYLLRKVVAPNRLAGLGEFEYAPWIVANLTVSGLPDEKGQPLCWDNVLFGKPSVGYVNASHQRLGMGAKKVLTFYWPLVSRKPAEARKIAYGTSYVEWQRAILKELEYAHRGVTKFVERIDIKLWGHGMIVPKPGFIWGKERAIAAGPAQEKIFFAHSDLSGISLFEEAFYQGIKGASQLIQSL